ncbi:uncharacterized protein LOC133474805 isoform X2 [Phyllopteryx taeniolatus]|uniref:uncharacterized protein LOC133474805 isoform X2 n=1 Tax=Phyllopteryx taeniolatus TaxID=161469 RepID=UPI002AD2FE5D|nr:uncharacterized protein LOC133474805 isoform X2 [Phyllopteryx taeniolatus]
MAAGVRMHSTGLLPSPHSSRRREKREANVNLMRDGVEKHNNVERVGEGATHCGLFERTIASYEEQLCRAREETERHRRQLEDVYKSHMVLHREEFLSGSTSPSPPGGEFQFGAFSSAPYKKRRGGGRCGDHCGGPPPPHLLSPLSYSDNTEEILIQVERRGVQKWVCVPRNEDCYDYSRFIQEGVIVDDDIFDQLLRSAPVSFKVSTEHSAENKLLEASIRSFSRVKSERSSSSLESASATQTSASTIIISTKRRKRHLPT